MIYDDYIQYCEEYEQIYGKDTLVLMQVGAFYEIYAVDNNENKSGADMYNIANILNITVSRKNKNIIENSNSNPLMAGFPNYKLDKFLDILIDNNYTVIIIDQTTATPNPKREVTRIISPGTYDESIINNESTNYIMSLYIESYNNNKSLAAGISSIDCSTGKTLIHEINDIPDKHMFFQELYKNILHIQPSEIIISSHDFITPEDQEIIIKLCSTTKIYDKFNNIPHDYIRKIFQQHILKKHFTNNSQLSIFEYLNIENLIIASISFTFLLFFTQSHYPNMDLKINKPKIFKNTDFLTLTNNTLHQLNITSGEVSLLNILNNCNSNIGKRYFKFRLLNPSTNIEFINNSYKNIELFENYDIQEIQNELKNTKDIEKIIRKSDSKFFPYDILNIYNTFSSINNIIENTNNSKYSLFIQVLEQIKNVFNVENKNIFNTLDSNIFKNTSDTDDLIETRNNYIKIFDDFISNMPNDIVKDHFKVEHNEKDNYFISITAKRFDSYKKSYKEYFKNCTYSNNKTTTKIYIPNEKQINNNITNITNKIDEIINNKFYSFVTKIKNDFNEEFKLLIESIEYFDFYSTCVSNNSLFRLFKPTIDTEKNSGFINAIELRHPIIENISKNIRYVSNNIELSNDGIVLYGINASGKSSLMKSIGIALILAQAGMYTSASSFSFHPYTKIFTRITGNDNIYRNQSTFVLEMSELRSIIKDCDDKSLIIGDEVCSGTETISAISIMTSTLYSLSKSKASYIFATHLHELNDYLNDTSAKVYHLSVKYENDQIIYDRVLKPGNGSTLYGLEVCKSLDMDDEFIKNAFKIRNKITNKNQNDFKISKYNSNIIKDKCNICSKVDNLHVHHIDEQHTADNEGYIKNFHKNDEHNLITLCEKCHNDVHSNKLLIEGYFSTSHGLKVQYKYINDEINFNSKEIIETVKKLRKSNTIKNTLKELNLLYDNKFTAYRLNNILKLI